jgi:hypothetical protein
VAKGATRASSKPAKISFFIIPPNDFLDARILAPVRVGDGFKQLR